jgi:hypothetical protein
VGTLCHPRPHERPGRAYGVLGGVLLCELSSFVVAVRAARSDKREATFLEYLREARDPTVVTVILEDSAALVGIEAELGPVTSDALIVIEPMRAGQRAVGRAA